MSAEFVGDELIPDAVMVFDRTKVIGVAPEVVWPWLVQLGKHRAGWYLPERIERWMPARWRASRTIVSRWQDLAVGDRIDDYGGKNARLEVVRLEQPHALVYRADRRGTMFTWALLLTPLEQGGTNVHLRFRGRVRSTGWRRRSISIGGDALDWATAVPMLAGLAERAEPVERVS